MPPSYKQSTALTSAATTFFNQRKTPCALSPYVVMTDPVRTPDVIMSADRLPTRSALIYRHFGEVSLETATALRRACFERSAQFLIGKDWQLAMQCGADGVHLPEADLKAAEVIRRRFPDWIITAAVHDKAAIKDANTQPLDAVMLSPVFKIAYRGGRPALGIDTAFELCGQSEHPVFALGGINESTVHALGGLPLAGIAGISGF